MRQSEVLVKLCQTDKMYASIRTEEPRFTLCSRLIDNSHARPLGMGDVLVRLRPV